MANKKVSQTLKTTAVGTADHTFEIIKEYTGEKGTAGEEAAVLQLYPTTGIADVYVTDSTTLHLQNKMKQLGWSKVHLLNLFSQIAKRKPLAGDLKRVDRENMAYIQTVISEVSKHGKIVIAWGNSHASNTAVNESKKELLEFLLSSHIGNVYHLIAETAGLEAEGTHILFLGLRYAEDKWQMADYPVQSQLEKILARLDKRPGKKEEPSQKKEPKQEKKERSIKNVF